MSKIFRAILACFIAISMCTWGTTVLASPDETSGAISISHEILGSTSLSISYLVTDATVETPGTGALTFDLSSMDLTDGSTLWAVADKCILVGYSSNYSWGIRIITNNQDTVDAMLAAEGKTAYDSNGDGITNIRDYVAPNWLDLDGDGTYGDSSYSGMLSVEDIQDIIDVNDGTVVPEDDKDPSKRATVAWMADAEWSTDYQTVLPTSSFEPEGTGFYIEDENVGDCWDFTDLDQWAYVGDKSDGDTDPATYADEIYTGSTTNLEYPIVVTGAAGSNGSLVPFTPSQADSDGDGDTDMVDLSTDDGDIVIYLAARFANTNWGDPANPFPYVLTPDSYSTSMYIELIHE